MPLVCNSREVFFMDNEHIIIIGAGASGLMAGRELSKAGKKVTVLEARDYLGGRIHTLYDAPFITHAELGAEWVHGDLPVSLALLDEAGIPYHKTGGKMWQSKNGELKQEGHQVEHWNLFEEKLEALKTDQTLEEFLQENFSGDKYEGVRDSARRYVSGFDTADPAKASALALRDEWLGEDEDQYRLDTGYQVMIRYLADEIEANGGEIFTDTIVKNITHGKDGVTVQCDNGESYRGSKVIITVPIGVLQAPDNERGAISFSPELPETKNAIAGMAMGAIIKVLLQFTEAFWENEEVKKMTGKRMDDLGFIISDQQIPTYWTQYPKKNALLTAWVGGPAAAKMKEESDEHIMELTIQSLSNIFHLPVARIKGLLATTKVVNWTADDFSRGSYSYAAVTTAAARKILDTPINDRIYFAGEAMYDGPEMGTVEAALASGKHAADKILGRK
jgi:monoamine oxidase